MKSKKLTALLLAGVLATTTLAGCGINKNATLATYTGGQVSLGLANFFVRYIQAEQEDMYTSYLGEDPWNKDPYGSGSTMGDNVKDSAVEQLHEMYTLRDHMADYNVSLSSDEEAAIKKAASDFMAANEKKTLSEMGATQELVEELLTLFTIQDKMHDAIIADVDRQVPDEEANMRAYTMLNINTSGYYDSSYNFVSYTDDEKQEMIDTATAIYEEVEKPEDLESAAEAHGRSTTTGTYDADNNSLAEEVKTALDGLKEGELSGLISTDSAMYLVRLDKETDEEATEKNRQSIISEREQDLYDSVLEGWQENDSWTIKDKELAKITFKNGFTLDDGQDKESTDEDNKVSETVDGDAVEDASTEMESTEADAE